MKSLQLSSFLHQPGLFYNDNPYVFPHEEMSSEDDDLSYAPFHCHLARDAQNEVEDGLYAGHIIYGDSQKIKIGLKGIANSNSFNVVTGSGLLFKSFTGPERTQDAHDPTGHSTGQTGYPQAGNCFSMTTHNQLMNPTGLYLGRTLPDEILLDDGDNADAVNSFFASKARWCSPLGVQFKWSSRGSKKASASINFSKITLIFMDNWMPGRTLYMPLIIDHDFVNNNSFYRGSDPLTSSYGNNLSGDDRYVHGFYGEMVAYAQPEVMEYLADPFTRAVCVGMYWELLQSRGQTAVYDIAREIFDFKFLFDMPDGKGNMFASNSMFVYPAPYRLDEALEGNTVQLL
jgi:hypothetical protein